MNTTASSAPCSTPLDGHLDPSGTTHAYAKAARIGGRRDRAPQPRRRAETPRTDGTWDVVTEQGTIHAEHVVNCRRPLGARGRSPWSALELPVLAMEHQYLVTDDMPEVMAFNKERGHELPHVIDFKAEIYLRQEGRGLCSASTSKACEPWQPTATPWDFGHELLPPDLDRIEPNLELGYRHFPVLAKRRHQARDQRPLHLLARRQPAGRPGAGPAQLLVRLRASWRASARAAASAWRSRSGWSRAIPGFDVWAMDVARFGEWATRGYTNEKVRENYARRFSIRFPNEELPARAPAADHRALRHDGRAGRGHGRLLGPGDAAVVRAQGRRAEGRRLLPPLQRLPACEGRGACGTRNGVGVTEIANFAKYGSRVRAPKPSSSRLMTNKHAAPGPPRPDADAEPQAAS